MTIKKKMPYLSLGSILNKVFLCAFIISVLGISCQKQNRQKSVMPEICTSAIQKAYYDEYLGLFIELQKSKEITTLYQENYQGPINDPKYRLLVKNCYDIDIIFSNCITMCDTTYIEEAHFYKDKQVIPPGGMSTKVVFYKNAMIKSECCGGLVFSNTENALVIDSVRNYYTPLFEAYLMQHKDKFPKELFEDIE